MSSVMEMLNEQKRRMLNIFPGEWPGLQAGNPADNGFANENVIVNALAPSTPLLSQGALVTLLLIYLNRKEDKETKIKWGWRSYEYCVLSELAKKNLITNPVGGTRYPNSLWLTQAGAALGNLISDMLLPEVTRVMKALKTQEMP